MHLDEIERDVNKWLEGVEPDKIKFVVQSESAAWWTISIWYLV